MTEIEKIKQKYQIIGRDPRLDYALNVAVRVAPTDLPVFINGESGTGKEIFPRIIHDNSDRRHGPYLAINCGGIPEGTIDSELFGHEKGAYTGALDSRKGYFEVANEGTLFMDEIGELPMSIQAKLLRVLESGEFMRVGSSKVQKTNVRVIAATNVNIQDAIEKGKFREDLYYRLNTIPIAIPPLRERKDDIELLFLKFSMEFAEKYKVKPIRLTPDAMTAFKEYRWYGNVRELKNTTDRMSVLEAGNEITADMLKMYLPTQTSLPVLIEKPESMSERDILYGVLFDMRREIGELRKIINDITNNQTAEPKDSSKQSVPITQINGTTLNSDDGIGALEYEQTQDAEAEFVSVKPVHDNLSLQNQEKEMIIKALKKHGGNRKNASKELQISERTLYRKIKGYDIEV